MIGKTISHYTIQEKLGEGGMGKVYLALDTKLQRKVALKFLLPQFTTDEEIRSRFKTEACTMAALNHPNIVTVYEVGEYEISSYIAMEYIEGKSLEEMLNANNLSINQSLDIAIQLCEGLRQAHNQGIFHRDIKPGNILIEKSGRLKILDFGLAKLKEASRKTSKSTTLGTLYYLSPEQIQNSNVDQRADTFATGIVLYEMITGQLPFKGEYEASVIHSILNEEPEPLARYKSGVSKNLQHIVDKTLSKDPERRYQHVDELSSDLKQEKDKINISKTSSSSARGKKIRKLAAILFADIVGYSRMMGNDEDAAFNLLEKYNSIVEPLIEQYNGMILKKIGDGLFCEFSSAIEAVECSIELQKSLHEFNKKSDTTNRLMVRIGIHVGDVIKKDNDLFGDGVNVAARIEPLAPPGGIYVSDSINSAISSHPRFKIVKIGPRALKNINKEHVLYQILTGLESEDSEIRSDETVPSELKKKDEKLYKQTDQKSKLNKKIIYWAASLVIIIIVVVTFNEQLFDLLRSTQSGVPAERRWYTAEPENNEGTINPVVSEILKSDKSRNFVTGVTGNKNSEEVLQYLQNSQNNGNLTFGRKDSYSDLNGKYIVILDEQKVYTILLFQDSKYFDTLNNKVYEDLARNFRGKRTIWVELF